MHNKRTVVVMFMHFLMNLREGKMHCQNLLLVKHDKFMDSKMEHTMSINNGNSLESKNRAGENQPSVHKPRAFVCEVCAYMSF